MGEVIQLEKITDTPWDGLPITKPGVYTGVDLDTYHHDAWLFGLEPSFSSTGLKQIIRRPSEYWCGSTFNPKKYEKERKPHLALGAAAHALILGDEVWTDRYAIRPDVYLGKKWNGNRNELPTGPRLEGSWDTLKDHGAP